MVPPFGSAEKPAKKHRTKSASGNTQSEIFKSREDRRTFSEPDRETDAGDFGDPAEFGTHARPLLGGKRFRCSWKCSAGEVWTGWGGMGQQFGTCGVSAWAPLHVQLC